MDISISKEEARRIIIDAARLPQPAPFGKGIEAVYQLIDHLGYVQIDTNYVVERAHHHAIFSRVPDYRTEWLGELQEEGRIFEFLMSDSGYMPMHDYRFSLPLKESFQKHGKPLAPPEKLLMKRVLDRIEREGPLSVDDFEDDRTERSSGWWDWRPAKRALERLYVEGSLMVTRSKNFKKLYDLPFNVLPSGTDQTMPSPQEYARHVILRTLKGLGIASAKELAWRARYTKGNLVKAELQHLVGKGEVCNVTVEGLKRAVLYTLPEYRDRSIEISGDAFILSPFDIINVFRHRLKDFFDFDYQIECFVPEPKRKYGYFSLPILIGDRFIARMDSKADRKNKTFLVHNLHFEAIKIGNPELEQLAAALRKFIAFNQCETIVFSRTNNDRCLKTLRRLLK